jgi:hypothetical protein
VLGQGIAKCDSLELCFQDMSSEFFKSREIWVHSRLIVAFYFVCFVTPLCFLWNSYYTKVHKVLHKVTQRFFPAPQKKY